MGLTMLKVMIVDDDYVISEELKEVLLGLEYDVVGIAGSGEDAIEMAPEVIPDVVLMDIVMPGGMDGTKAAETVMELIDCAVVFVTGYGDDAIVERAKNVEPHGYLLKPFEAAEVKACVEIAFHKKEIEDRLKKAYDKVLSDLEEKSSELEALNFELEKGKKALESKTTLLEDANIALKMMLQKSDENKKEVEKEVLSMLKKMVAPYISKIKKSEINPDVRQYINTLEDNLKHVVSPFSRNLSFEYLTLTPKEIQVADLVREGKSTQEISEALNMKVGTTGFYRNKIREKMGIKGKKIGLRSHLLTLRNS
ncbi:MAG: response regulator [Deltaproteobacteria bacterium]|nr:response regulator [Deltaproteobacteria bacterium]